MVRRNKSYKRLKIAYWATGIASVLFICYIGYLWWWRTEDLKFVTYKEFGIPIPQKYSIHGIDVSRYQEMVSWKAVKEMNVKNVRLGFVFIKATEGVKNVDPYFKRNWKKAKEAGVIRGAYHFFIPSKDGNIQAKNFLKTVKLGKGDLPPVLDVEKTYGMSTAQIRREVKKWLDAMEAAYGVKPILYTYVSFYTQHFDGVFDDYPLWVAHYLQPEKPRIKRNWSFWQHSERGRVNGIRTKVDFNVFNGDSSAFKALLVP